MSHAAQEKLKAVLRALRKNYGPRKQPARDEVVGTLIETILSQNTNRGNSTAGFAALTQKFSRWDQVADATEAQVARCIKVSGLSQIKSPRIIRILREIRRERGKIDLEFLRDLTPQQAYDYLMQFKGVGPKTAWCTLMFACGMRVFPVDTHIHRIAIRLGALEAKTTAEAAHERLAPLIDPADRYALHVLLIEHGRKVCLARNPRCSRCFLLRYCPDGKRRMEQAMDG